LAGYHFLTTWCVDTPLECVWEANHEVGGLAALLISPLVRLRGFLIAIIAALATAGPGAAAALDVTSVREWTVVAAGDIASCEAPGAAETSPLVQSLGPDAVLTLGDNAYPDGTADDYARCYEPTWGAFKAKTFPAPGNHDYHTPGAAAYFDYFGSRAPGPFYSFNLGPWHIVSLNSEIPHGVYAPQLRWLRRDLAADSRRCELLYWHRPRWSGGPHGSDLGMSALWRAAYNHGVDVVLAGHEHSYQRFYRLDSHGRFDGRYGVRQLIVGTGGNILYAAGKRLPGRTARVSSTHGVLELTLRAGGYEHRFVPAPGSTWTDVVPVRNCHGTPPRR
jgi:acid phosphatase type 7